MRKSYNQPQPNKQMLYEAIMKEVSGRVKKLINESFDESSDKITVYTFSDDYGVDCYNDDDIYGFLEYLKDESYFRWKTREFDTVEAADYFQEGYLGDYYDERAPYSKVILRSDIDFHRKWMLAIDKYNEGILEEPGYDPYEDPDFN